MARRPRSRPHKVAAIHDPILHDNGPVHEDDISQFACRDDIEREPQELPERDDMIPPADALDVAELETGGEGGAEDDIEDDGALDPDEFQTAISKGIEQAENYIDMELSPEREDAARYYRAAKFGNEVAGKSAIVMSEVRDSVLSLMPGTLRMFTGPVRPVEFESNEGTPDEQADQQTDYVHHVINKDNPGFTIHHSAFKDAFVRRTGIYTWEWEEKEIVSVERFSGLNEDAMTLLEMEAKEASSDDDLIQYSVVVTAQKEDSAAEDGLGMPLELANSQPADLETMPGAPQIRYTYDGYVKRRDIKKRVRIRCVPPEEFILTPVATDNIDEFPLVGTRQMMTIGDLVAIGHSEDEIREALGGAGTRGNSAIMSQNQEAAGRNPAAITDRIFENSLANVDPQSEEIKYCVIYVLVDFDGDGIRERRKICTVGDNNKILYNQIFEDDMVPFGLLCPDPEPHSPFGYSIADQTMDIQEVKSEMVRGILDSLAQAIENRLGVVEGKVNIDDLLGGADFIRTKEQGAVWSLSSPFVGMQAMPVLEYIDAVKQRRTGANPTGPGALDIDALQSTSKEATQSVIDSSQERAELIARIFAETGIARLYKGVRNLIIRHQDHKRILRLRGKYHTIDPRTWTADLDTAVNVGTGRAVGARRLNGLMMIAAQQKEIYQAYGPNNPLVSLQKIHFTQSEIIRELGFNDPSRFINDVTPDIEDQLKQAAAEAANKPTPQQLLAQASAAETMVKLRLGLEKEATARAKMILDDDRGRDKADQDFAAKATELLGKFGLQISEQAIKQQLEADRGADQLAQSIIQQATGSLNAPNTLSGGKANIGSGTRTLQ